MRASSGSGSPAALTVRVGADGPKFTVLAEFEDGVVGDITAWTNLSWSSTAPEGRRSPMGALGYGGVQLRPDFRNWAAMAMARTPTVRRIRVSGSRDCIRAPR